MSIFKGWGQFVSIVGKKMNTWEKENVAFLFIIFDISCEFPLTSGVGMGKDCVS